MSPRPWKRVTANGRTWSIHWRKDLEIGDSGSLDGAMLPTERIIILDSRLRKDPEELLDTLVHELLHAAYYSEDATDLDEEVHGRVSRTLAQLLAPFMRKIT